LFCFLDDDEKIANVNVNKTRATVDRMKIQCAHVEEEKKGNNAMRYSRLFTLKQCRNEFIFRSVPELNKVAGLISTEKKNILSIRRPSSESFPIISAA